MRSVTLVWPGGEHPFLLRLGELRALQSQCDAGPEEIMARLAGRGWFVDDIVDALRLGLIGAGMPTDDARALVTKTLQREPLINFKPIAYTVLAASLVGVEDDPVGEATGARTEASPASGGSPASTA